MNRLFFSRESKLPLLARAFGLLLIAFNTGRATPVVVSDFSVSDEGWRVFGDGTSAVPTYLSTGGASNGFVRAFDSVVGGVWFWDAPSKFLGNHSPSYGTPLTYQLRMRGSGPLFEDSRVILEGGGVTLHLVQADPAPMDIVWTEYTAMLSDSANWRVGTSSGPLATQTQIQSVLANVTRLRIRGEFITGSDNGDLDNVTLRGIAGDYNNNGTVDAADYTLYRDALGTNTTLPNDTTPGSVTSADYAVWKSNFGSGSASGAAQAVPEPRSTIVLLIALVSGICLPTSRITR
jgi:hypothetical protein